MAISIQFNGAGQDIASVEQLGELLDRIDETRQFELWACKPEGPSMCMLRNGDNAWLMYLRHEEDSGFNSIGNVDRDGVASYVLDNGQEDEYPLAWCIDVEQCYKAIAYFCVNNGAQPAWISWHEN